MNIKEDLIFFQTIAYKYDIPEAVPRRVSHPRCHPKVSKAYLNNNTILLYVIILISPAKNKWDIQDAS